MSFKLFFASSFGLIKSTAKLEAIREALLADYRMFCKYEQSAELKEYHELELLVNSATFRQEKKEIQQLAFRGSKEEAQLKELKEIERKNRLPEFYKILKSDELSRYEKISISGLLATYEKLKATVKSFSAFSPKEEELKRVELLVTKEFRQLNESDDWKFFTRFGKSAAYKNYLKLKYSPERKRFEELQEITSAYESNDSNLNPQDKQILEKVKAAQLKELKKLEGSTRLQKFLTTLKSEELKRFEKISASGLLATHEKLKETVKSFSMFSPKKEEVKREEILVTNEFRKLKDSDDWKFLTQFGKSTGYRNYLRLKDSPERKRFEELQKITDADEFKARVIYLEDKKKWEKTEESAKEKQFAEMHQLPQRINYLKYKNSDAFRFFREWELVFEDRFETGKLDTKKWMTQSYWASQSLGQNFSQSGDLHAFTDGENVSVDGHSLKIEVRKEKAKSMVWGIPFGFVEQEFDYTSGIVSTAGSGWWKHGILEAKVKYTPSNHFVDAFYLLGDEGSPQISLLEMGAKNRVGLFSKTSNGIRSESESLSGLKSGEFYIFRLEWSAHSLVWKINNREVFVMKHNVPAFKIHLNIASILVSEPTEGLPHRFEIDWVRLYQNAKV